MRLSIGLAVAVCFITAGCVSLKKVAMVHPITRDIRWCEHQMTSMFGIQAAMVVNRAVQNCIKQMEALGYRKAEDLTPEERETLLPGAKTRQF